MKPGPCINVSDYDLENNEPNPYYQNNAPRLHQNPDYPGLKNHTNGAKQGSQEITRPGALSEIRNQPLVVPLPFLAELRSRRKSETPDSRHRWIWRNYYY